MKRLWGIRHIRFWFKMVALNMHVDRCRSIGLGICASQADIDYLQDVWDGKA